MKLLIVYYSQTGNTQKIARAIRDGIREKGHDVTLSFLKNTSYELFEGYDVIGFGSPIWYEMPPNLRKFVEALPNQNGKLCFSFCTHGTMPDLYFPLAIPRLQRKGFRVLDWKNWYSDGSIQIFPYPYYTDGHPDDLDIKEAHEFGASIAEKAEQVLSGNDSILPPAPMPNMMPMHANAAIEHLGGFHNIHGKLIRDSSKCLYPKCTICMDHCTMSYIDLGSVPQKFGNLGTCCDDCHGCTYCEMICPTGAIRPEVPYEIAAPVGEDHGSELFCKVLAKAEEDGKFRRLIPFDKVGTKTPFYSAFNKHPRIKTLSLKDDL